jgi:serine/threonine protein kinase
MTEERPSDVAGDATLQAGQVVAGTYRIERLLGKGGMAAVWEATSLRTHKRVALKAIRGGPQTDPAAADMLRREALAASRINHPNVVNIYDVIEHGRLTCIVMEILDGEPLSAYLARQGHLGLEEAVTLLLPAMRGVAAANALGVIHRDLKPQNIFICIGADGRMLTTKVLDFGISVAPGKLSAWPQAAQTVPTHGTPAYMSPEHIQGLAELDGRADVYGFGVLFFEALTGRLPFPGAPGPELLMRILKDPPPKVTRFRPDLPVAVADIVERALAKEPKDRFANLDAFIAIMEAYLLPPAQLPRALTPIAGVSLLSATEPKTGTRSVPPVAESAPSPGGRNLSDTKKIFPLPRAAGADPRAGRPSSVSPADGVAVAEQARSATGRPRRPRWSHYLGAAVMFGGMLLFIAWLAFPDLSHMGDATEAAAGGPTRPGQESGFLAPAVIPGTGRAFIQPDGGG